MHTIYLDYNATTPVDREVVAVMEPLLSNNFGNPSSNHSYGFKAREVVENARHQVAALLSCLPEEIVFTSGGTESNNHAIRGIAQACKSRGRHVITSAVEHPATLEACRYLDTQGFKVSYLPVDSMGRLMLDELENAIRKDTVLITVMHANNEIGTIQPIENISRLAKARSIPFHTDAAQSAGKISVNVRDLGVDLLSLAGHKIYGPKGVGALYIRGGLELEKLIHGADHESNRRAGTENVLLIAGFGKACEIALKNLETNRKNMMETRDALLEKLSASLPDVVRNGDPGHCLPNTLSISFPGTEANVLLAAMPQIAASAGAACHAESTEISHVLEAIGLDEHLALGTIRLSTGKGTTMQEIENASEIIIGEALPLLESGETAITGKNDSFDIKLTRFTRGLGCACKMRPQDLEEVLKKMPYPEQENILVDARDSDDATVWKIDEDIAWVQSVDFFTPIVDDPFDFGRIAAANALSDLYAMGATPLFALNIVAFPSHRLPLEVLHRILTGAQSTAAEAGIAILGGHTIEDNEIKYGMAVNGRIHPDRIIRNSGARPGDALILTKPIGTGILATALKRGRLKDQWLDTLVDTMAFLNSHPASHFGRFNINAATDVTGFGLLGHLYEMIRASKVSARISAKAVPLLPGLEESLVSGMAPGGSIQNLEYIGKHTIWTDTVTKNQKIALADAQTSGGLLISLPGDEAEDYLKTLNEKACPAAAIIGEITASSDSKMTVS